MLSDLYRGGLRDGKVLSLTAGDHAWLQEGNMIFRVDLAGPTLGPSFALGAEEEVATLEDHVAVIKTADEGVRGMNVESGEDLWRIEADRRPYLERRRRFSMRWWYASTEHQTQVLRLDYKTGQFGPAQVLEHASFHAPTLYSWSDEEQLVAGRGRDLYFVHADGRAPEHRSLPAEPGGDPRFVVPFAGTWYVQGTGEGPDGPLTRLVPLNPARPTLTCDSLLFPSPASGDRLVIASASRAYVWGPDDERPSETYLGPVEYSSKAVVAGPYAAVLTDTGTLFVQGPAGHWSAFQSPGDALVEIVDHGGSPLLAISGAGLALCPIAEMAALGPGPQPLPVRTIATPAPTPPLADVTFVGQTTGQGIAMHPQFGRLTFDARTHPGTAKGEKIEILERDGTVVSVWKPVEDQPNATGTRDDVIPAPGSTGAAPSPPPAEPFESLHMLDRWRARAEATGVTTPPLLARVFAAYDSGPVNRSRLERAFFEVDPVAELDDGIPELLAEAGERRPLIGFAQDVEGAPIGFVPGATGVYCLDDGEFWECDESFEAWVEARFEDLEDDGATELLARLRELLQLPAPESNLA